MTICLSYPVLDCKLQEGKGLTLCEPGRTLDLREKNHFSMLLVITKLFITLETHFMETSVSLGQFAHLLKGSKWESSHTQDHLNSMIQLCSLEM